MLLCIPLIILFFLSFLVGRYPIAPYDVVITLVSKVIPINSTVPPSIETVIFQVRLPRILAAMLVGAALSIAGASFQGLFKNPLVAPDKLGVSAGAGFAAALAILLSLGTILIQVFSFFWWFTCRGTHLLYKQDFQGNFHFNSYFMRNCH
nr:iron chelate uptake ABC transporter family permease subunit [Methanobacterium sp.]